MSKHFISQTTWSYKVIWFRKLLNGNIMPSFALTTLVDLCSRIYLKWFFKTNWQSQLILPIIFVTNGSVFFWYIALWREFCRKKYFVLLVSFLKYNVVNESFLEVLVYYSFISHILIFFCWWLCLNLAIYWIFLLNLRLPHEITLAYIIH